MKRKITKIFMLLGFVTATIAPLSQAGEAIGTKRPICPENRPICM